MSIEYCHNCDKYIDTDYDAEHLEECNEETNMKLTNTQKEYLFENGWRGQIETNFEGNIDITLFDEANKVVITDSLEKVKEFHQSLGELLEEIK